MNTKFKLALPALLTLALSALGGTKGLLSRLKAPEAELQNCAAATGAFATTPVTPEQWRAVEAVQAQLLTDGIVRQATPRN